VWCSQFESEKPSRDAGFRAKLEPKTPRFPDRRRRARPVNAPPIRASGNHAGSRALRWRDPDSNRGHHDFQSWSRISLTGTESLQIRWSAQNDGRRRIAANCGLLSPIWVLRRRSVPNQIARSRYATWRDEHVIGGAADGPRYKRRSCLKWNRLPGCGPGGRGFESRRSPLEVPGSRYTASGTTSQSRGPPCVVPS
jgi:hypothetical protein